MMNEFQNSKFFFIIIIQIVLFAGYISAKSEISIDEAQEMIKLSFPSKFQAHYDGMYTITNKNPITEEEIQKRLEDATKNMLEMGLTQEDVDFNLPSLRESIMRGESEKYEAAFELFYNRVNPDHHWSQMDFLTEENFHGTEWKDQRFSALTGNFVNETRTMPTVYIEGPQKNNLYYGDPFGLVLPVIGSFANDFSKIYLSKNENGFEFECITNGEENKYTLSFSTIDESSPPVWQSTVFDSSLRRSWKAVGEYSDHPIPSEITFQYFEIDDEDKETTWFYELKSFDKNPIPESLSLSNGCNIVDYRYSKLEFFFPDATSIPSDSVILELLEEKLDPKTAPVTGVFRNTIADFISKYAFLIGMIILFLAIVLFFMNKQRSGN